MYTWKHYSGSANHKTWGVYTPSDELLTVCLYRKGAIALCEYLNKKRRKEFLVQRPYGKKKQDLWINCHRTTELELAEYYIDKTIDPDKHRILEREVSEWQEVKREDKKNG
jgi:hypothetical protein